MSINTHEWVMYIHLYICSIPVVEATVRIWISHVTYGCIIYLYERVMSHMDGSCPTRMNCIPRISHVTYGWIIHLWKRHVTYVWITYPSRSHCSHMNKSCHIWMNHTPMNKSCHIWMHHISMNKSHHTWMSINTYVWVMHIHLYICSIPVLEATFRIHEPTPDAVSQGRQ